MIFWLWTRQFVAILTFRLSALSSISGLASHRMQHAAILNDTRCSTVSSASVLASHRTQSAAILDDTDAELFSLASELTSQRKHCNSLTKIRYLGQGLRNREKYFSVIYQN